MSRWLAWSGLVLFLSACASSNAQDGNDAAQGADGPTGADASGAGFGEPCDELSDCASGLCYQPSPPDPGVCTQDCEGQCPDGYECKVVMISDFTDRRVCVPAEETMCATCDSSDDCGDSSDFCVELTDGYACTIDCTGNPSICPTGFTCQQVAGVGDTTLGMQCMPLNGLCCLDEDGDLRGDGSQCLNTDCDDTDADIYDDAAEVCDGKDNDCTGGADNDPIDCASPSCDLGTGAYFEQAREPCDGTVCVDQPPVSCGLYTCSGGAEVGDECADACDVEVDDKCVDLAHCDVSACLADLANGEACDELSDCISSHCGNDFCCQAGDCCQVASDCPTFGTVAPVCNDPTTCQGTRGEAVCNANFQCQSSGVEQDDSACSPTTLSDDCGFYLPMYCNGNVNQADPACPSSCASDAACDPNGFCNAANLCVEDQDDGKQCNDDAECKSDHCQNGYCCSSGDCCAGPGNCPPSYSSAPACDSQATCQGSRDDATCINFICGTSLNVGDDTACTGLANDCGYYVPTACNGTGNQTPPQCLGTCSSDLQCDASAYCRTDGVCAPDNPDGFQCGDDAECSSGHCANGYCCASGDCCSTGNDCNAYDVSPTCTDAANCQGGRIDGVCNAAKQCVGQAVDDDSGCNGQVADTCGPYPSVTCTSATSQSKPPCAGTCGPTVMCDTGNYCDGTSHCAPTGDPGSSCTDPLMCDTGLSCTDGVCCDTSCTGVCKACDLGGTSGTCSNVPNGQDPDTECNGFMCNGYYYGWVGDRCYDRADATDFDVNCNGAAGCRTAATDCPTRPQGDLVADCNDTCQSPTGGTCTGTTAGACTNLNLGNTTCGTGYCQRTVATCTNGSPNTCVPGNPTTEVCNGTDEDCDGNISEGTCTLPNVATTTCPSGVCNIGTCNNGYAQCDASQVNGCEVANTGWTNTPNGPNLGTWDGDAYSGSPFCGSTSCGLRTTQTGVGGRYFWFHVNEGSICSAWIGARIKLDSPVGADYDLYVSGPCGASPGFSSELIGDDEIEVWCDDSDSGNNGFDVRVEVRHYLYGGSSCNPWTVYMSTGNCWECNPSCPL